MHEVQEGRAVKYDVAPALRVMGSRVPRPSRRRTSAVRKLRDVRSPPETIVAADIGGTFTDVVVQEGRSLTRVLKVLTTPRRPSDAVMASIQQLGPRGAREFLHATTLATNALLDPSRAMLSDVGLLTTEGFADVIEIGRQNRPGLYDLYFRRPRTLVDASRRVEVSERTAPSGRVERRLEATALRVPARRLRRLGVRSVAVSFLHSYANPANEIRAARWLRPRFPYLSLSSEVAPEPREFERTSTAVVNAVLMPVVSDYISRLERELAKRDIHSTSVMASSGGLVSLAEVARRPVQIVESGPAAGVVAAAELGRRLRIESIISFDMGGTTAKAGTVVRGRVELTPELEVGGDSHHGRRAKGTGYPVRFPFVDLAEVSAGGGTVILRDDAGALHVGPRSAGSEPGPAAYGRGGTEPTLTDANLVLGVLSPGLLGGSMSLDLPAARRALATLGPPEVVAEQALRLANLEMARAIRIVTVERGLDPREYTLVAFGGAGPQHAAALAEEVGTREVTIPRDPGVFSATGLLSSDWQFEGRAAFPKDLPREVRRLRGELSGRIAADRFVGTVECRYEGQGFELAVPLARPRPDRVRRDFERLHEATFGFRMDRPVELVLLRLFAVRRRPRLRSRYRASGRPNWGERVFRWDGRERPIKTCQRDGLAPGTRLRGPVAVEEYGTTTLVPPSWRATVLATGELRLFRGTT